MVNSGNAFPTLYHRIKQSKSPTRESISDGRRPSASVTMSALAVPASTMPTSTFPALTRFFQTFILAAQIPFVRAGGIGDELSNNIITDLAPLLSLFGEQITKQFMSQSMGVVDNIIFAVAPLGIITAIVGAIRVGGPKALTAMIGRARESRSAVEIELMSSTSTDVCELWDGQGVVRALGAPPIIELIYVVPKEKLYGPMEPETLKIWTEGNFGIYDFDSAIRTTKNPVLELESTNSGDPPGDRSRGAAPNISMNLGKHVSNIETYTVAVFGVMLQLAVIVYAVLSFALSPWNLQFQKTGYSPAIYVPLMICGTVALAIGMYLCSHIIEQSTVEESWNVTEMAQAQVQVAWLQKGGVVNDQLFDSYALFPTVPKRPLDLKHFILSIRRAFFASCLGHVGILLGKFLSHTSDYAIRLVTFILAILLCPATICFMIAELYICPGSAEYFIRFYADMAKSATRIHVARGGMRVSDRNRNPRLSIRTSRQTKTIDQHILVVIAALISLCGFVGQFLGLRGLHWSVTVAQLAATLIMTVLRASIRRNIIHKPKTQKLDLGYELDWMAREGVKSCAHWSVVTWGFDRPIHPPNKPHGTLATATMTARRRLSALSKWPSKWQDSVNSTAEAIEGSLNFMFSSPDITLTSDWSTRDRFEWKMVVQVGMLNLDTTKPEKISTHLEEITLTLKRTKLLDGPWGPWRAVRSEIEAVLGLWMLHFKDLDKPIQAAENLESDEPIQVAEASDWQNDEDGYLRGKPILRVLGPYNAVERMSYDHWIRRQTNCVRVDDVKRFTERQTKTCDMVIAGSKVVPVFAAPVLGVITSTILERICGQVILSQFMLNVAEYISIGGTVDLRPSDQGLQTSFGLTCPGLTGLVTIVERAGLANTEEAYMSIVPALNRKLPLGPNDIHTLFGNIVQLTNSCISNGELEKAEWYRLWLLHCAELSADIYKDRRDWKGAGEVYLHLRRESERLSHTSDHIEEVSMMIVLFCESIFASISMGARVEGGQRPLSSTLQLVGQCMTNMFGEISETALASWKSAAPGDVADKNLCDAASLGNSFLVALLIDSGADIEQCGSDHRTPLILSCISGHAAVAGQLIKQNADTNAKDYHGQTPLHHASQKGHTSIVQLLLFNGSLTIDARDRMGLSALDLAIQQNIGAIVNLLLFYGAEDRGGKARKLIHIAIEKGSEAGVNRMVDENVDLNLVDAEYGRTPLHWAVWIGSKKGLKRLLEKEAQIDVTDQLGDTLLHIATMGGSVAVVQTLLGRQIGVDVKGQRGETSLHRAASAGHESIVELLLNNGANIDSRDEGQYIPLHLATSNGHLAAVQLLLSRSSDIESRDIQNQTPLHHAASNGHLEMTQLLLDHGANMEEVQNTSTMTPLHFAAKNGHTATAQLLLDRGAEKEVKDAQQQTPLHLAISNGHIATAQLLLDRGVNMEAQDKNKWTPLHFAARYGQTPTAQLLLDRGANIEARNKNTWTPLRFAARYGQTPTAQLLLDRGANMEARDENRWTPLHFAASNGQTPTTQLLLDRGADMEARDENRRTPLHFAANYGQTPTAQLLLDRGANMEAQDGIRWTPLHFAASNGQTPTVQLLLDRGANMEVLDVDRRTPLHFAARYRETPTAQLLLDRGANMEVLDENRSTPLHWAARYGRTPTAQLLLDRGANMEVLDENRSTPLHFAARYGRTPTAQLLLDRGANMETQDGYGYTPLHSAASNGQTPTAQLLLDRGANMEAQNEDRQTPLHLAARYGQTPTAQLLLDRGADMEAQDENRRTPLHFAVYHERAPTAQLLLDRGANIEAQNGKRQTPLQLAASNWETPTAQLLLDRGANMEAQDENRWTPLHWAAYRERIPIAQLLLDRGGNNNAINLEGKRPIDLAQPNGEIYELMEGWKSPTTSEQN